MNAMYVMEYKNDKGSGFGVICLVRGKILGTDVVLSRYEGTYHVENGRLIALGAIRATVISPLITGAVLQPGASLRLSFDWPADFTDDSVLNVEVGQETVSVTLTKIGDF